MNREHYPTTESVSIKEVASVTNRDVVIGFNGSIKDLAQVLSRRILRFAVLTLFVGTLLTLANGACASPDLVRWPGCPVQWAQYNFSAPSDFPNGIADPYPAHAEPFPVAAPNGGNCSLDVVSGTLVSIASSAGGFAFDTPGEVAGGTYTINFEMQWVSGQGPWAFSNQEGKGIQNGLTVSVPYPGDNCWHRYEYTAALGPIGPKTVMFVYQANPGPQEMRIANLTLRAVEASARHGLVVSNVEGNCCKKKTESR